MADTPAPSEHVPASNGAIYDIGYRGYDGPRLGRAYRLRTLALHTLKGAFGLGRTGRAKIAPFLLLTALCGPAVVMVAAAALLKLSTLPASYEWFILDVQVLHTIWIGVLAPFAVSRDLRFRVTTLYFSRPLERLDYLVAKYAATVSGLLVMSALPVLVLYLGALLAGFDATDELPEMLRALVIALLTALLLAAIGLLVASFAPRRGMGIVAIVAVLLVAAGVEVVLMSLGIETGHERLATFAAIVSPYSLVEQVVAGVLQHDFAGSRDRPDSLGDTLVFVGAYAALLGGALLLLVRRYRKVSVL